MNTPEAANSLQVSILDRLSKGEETAAAFKRYLHAPAHQKAMEDLEKAVIDANTLLTLIQHLLEKQDWDSHTCGLIAYHLKDYGLSPNDMRS
jgi:hypothetical protein